MIFTLILGSTTLDELDIVHLEATNGEEAMSAFAIANPKSPKTLVAAIGGKIELSKYDKPEKGITFPGDGTVKVAWLASQLAHEEEQSVRKDRHKQLTELFEKLREREDCQAEYQQISQAMPAHPWEDPTAEWWSTDAPAVIESIEDLLATEPVA
jgi:hypothetical protein